MSTNLEQMSQEKLPFMLLSCASQFVSFMNKYVNIILWCWWRWVGRCDLISYEHQSCTDVPGKLTLHNAPLMLIELKQVTYVEDHCPLLSLQIGWYHGTIVIVSWSHYHLFKIHPVVILRGTTWPKKMIKNCKGKFQQMFCLEFFSSMYIADNEILL